MSEEHGGQVTGLGRVLLIEDDELLRGELAAVLIADGWAVDAAGDVDAALDAPPPDVVIAEAGPVGRGGMELLRRIRGTPVLAQLPVILLIAPGPKARAEALAAGADDYLAGPFGPPELLGRVRIRYLLARRRIHTQRRAEHLAPILADAVTGKRLVDTATGTVMAACGMSPAQAGDMLRAAAAHSGRPISDIAAEIVHTGRGEPAEASRPGGLVQVSVVRGDGAAMQLRAVGPIDLIGSVLLARSLEQHIQSGRRHVQIDLSQVTFMAEAGIDALLVGQRRLQAHGGTLTLTRVGLRIRRLLQLTGRAQTLQIQVGIDDPAAESVESPSGRS